jgi:phosphoglycolate phosphatase-like HAD superfamily hydrolase
MRDHDWVRILDPGVIARLGRVKHALFDFDGTISTLRQGWESVMLSVMCAAVTGGQPVDPAIEDEVRVYIDASTGILTIQQMEWLAKAAKRHGLARRVLPPAAYKRLYLRKLMKNVDRRIALILEEQVPSDSFLVNGARDVLEGLRDAGVILYIASGTDQDAVEHEIGVLHLDSYFGDRVFGAQDHLGPRTKAGIIEGILDDYCLAGPDLLVVGDGPVEIREAKLRKAIGLGVASDEEMREGWNTTKMARLERAGCDLMIADFRHAKEIVALLVSTAGE